MAVAVALITFLFSDCELIQNKVFQIIFLQNKVTKLRWHHPELGWPLPTIGALLKGDTNIYREECDNGDRGGDSSNTSPGAPRAAGHIRTREDGAHPPSDTLEGS